MLAGCAAEPAPAAPAADEPELTAVALYGRHAAVRGRADIRIANRGPGTVELEHYRVEHPLFARVDRLPRRSTLPPDGRERIVPVPFGAPRCEVDDPTGARVVVGVRTGDGVRDVAVPLSDGEPGLVRAHRLACAAQAVTAAASFDLGPQWVPEQGPEGLTARTTLRLERRGPGTIAVTQLSGNILFTVSHPAGQPLLTLPAEQDAAELAVRVRASRCEAHALTESKTSFTFPVFAAVGDAEPALVSMTVSPPARAALQDLLDRTCTPDG